MTQGSVQRITVDWVLGYQNRGGNAFQRDMRSMASSASAASQQAGSSLASLARFSKAAGTALLLGVGAALAVGIKAAIDFESVFAGVRKTVDASEPQFEALAMSIRQMATEIPLTTTELAQIGELGGQLGVPVGALDEFIEVIAKLGATTNLEIDEAATGFARLANVMGTPIDQFDNMGSAVVDLGNNFATTESEILAFGTRLSGIGSTIGLSEQDVLALATAFTSLGEPAERGATALQRTFIQFQNLASIGGSGLQQLADIMGVTADEARRLIDSDPTAAFVAFETGLGEIVADGGDAAGILKDLGLGAVRTTTLLLKGAVGVDTITRALSTSNAAWADNLALNEEANKRFDTTASQMSLLSNQFTEFRIALGNTFLDSVKDLVARLQGLFGVITDNLPLLKIFGAAILFLAGARGLLRLISSLQSATAATGSFFALFRTGRWYTDILAARSAVGLLQGAVMGLQGVLGIAAIAMGGVAVAMSGARARANEMRGAVGNLLDEMERLGDWEPDQLVDLASIALQKATEGHQFSEQRFREILDFLDVGTVELTELLLGSGADLEAWISQMETSINEGIGLAGVFSRSAQIRNEAGQPISEEIRDALVLFEHLRQVQEEMAGERAMRQREAARNLDFGEFGVTGEPFLQQPRGGKDLKTQIDEIIASQIGPEGRIINAMAIGLEGGQEKAEEVWMELLDGTREFASEWSEEWGDFVDGFNESLSDWESAWSGYELTTVTSLSKIKASVNNYILDQERRTSALAFVITTFGDQAGQIFAGLPESLQLELGAALGQFGEQAFLDRWAEIAKLHAVQYRLGLANEFLLAPSGATEAMESAWPAAFDEMWAGLTPGMQDNAQLTAEAGLVAFVDGFLGGLQETQPEVAAALLENLRSAATEATQQLQPELNGILEPGWVTNITDSMTTVERILAFRAAGYSWAESVALGFASYGLASKLGSYGRSAALTFQYQVNDILQVGSPSKWAMKLGEYVSEGFAMGLRGGMFYNGPRAPQPIVNVEAPSGSSGPPITINNPIVRDRDILDDLQQASILSGLVRTAEGS